MGEVEDLYRQLQQLRSYLPGLMHLLATFEDGETNRQVFFEVARSVETWRTAAVSFSAKYTELKARGMISSSSKPAVPAAPKESAEMVDIDYGFDDFNADGFGGTDFGAEYDLGGDLLEEGIGAIDEYTEL